MKINDMEKQINNGKLKVENRELPTSHSQLSNNKPQVRFPEFIEEWEVKKLGSIAKRITKKNTNFEVQKVLTNSATKGIISQEDFFDKKIANNKNLNNYYIANVDDFVYNPRISKYAPVGPLKRNNLDKGVLSPLYTVLRFNKGNLTFFEHYFETTYWYKYLRSIANYGARHDRMNITNDNFIKLPIPFPTLPEQTHIAHFFTTLDKKLNQLQQKRRRLEAYKKGMMQQLFNGELKMENGELKFEPPTLRFKPNSLIDNGELKMENDIINSQLSTINYPDWEVKKLGDLLIFKNGINASKEFYGKGFKFINVLDIINNSHITYDSIIGSVDVSQEVFDKNIVEYGDILFQRSSETREEVGQSNVYLDLHKKATFGGFVIRGKKNGNYIPSFLNLLLKTSMARKDITSKSGGSTRYNVGQEILSSISLLFPCLKEQTKIANFLSKIDEKINAVNTQIENTKTYKKGLLQRMFVN